MQDISFSDEVNVDRFRLASLPSPASSSLPAHDASVSLLTKNINTRISFVLRTRVSKVDAKKISFSIDDEDDKTECILYAC